MIRISALEVKVSSGEAVEQRSLMKSSILGRKLRTSEGTGGPLRGRRAAAPVRRAGHNRRMPVPRSQIVSRTLYIGLLNR